MNPEQYQKVKQLFMAALPLEPAARSAFLDAACGDDKQLRSEIDSIFKHHDPATILQPDPGPVQAAPTGTHRSGNQIAVRGPGDTAFHGQDGPQPLVAGTVVAGRYRIVDLLGRGGMGEVYRADDLKVGQPMALKFLAGGRANDPVWLARFREEVRLARRVTHPNVCRIYDIDEAGNHAFISMEYIDGEDLRSLLRRIGRLPRDKTLEVARQLCSGLAAAHEQGVLHRDLKPANIMLDGAGQVKITDFGIASLAPRPQERLPIAGTPAYIAPEILAGKPPSPESDIYSLGLVLYEMATGRPAFVADTFEKRLTEAAPDPLGESTPDVDASFGRLIMQCLNEDPARRPQSVYAVAASLPGADPLQIALAAGHTPSPDTVAAAAVQPIRPWVAWSWFAGAIASLMVVVFLAGRTFLLPQAGLARAPAVLEEQARRVIHELGRTAQTQGRVQGFVLPVDRDGRAESRTARAPVRPESSVYFEYRQGEQWTAPRGPLAMPTLFDQAWPMPGQRLVRLDPKGRLLLYRAEPPATDIGSAGAADVDWSVPFALAGLDEAAFEPISTKGGEEYADRRMAWRGPDPDDASGAVQVQAAAEGPWIVLFRVVDAERPAASVEYAQRIWPVGQTVRFGVFLFLLAGGAILAWRNIQQGQVDRRGAGRLAIFMLAVDCVLWVSTSVHSRVLAVEAGLVLTALRFVVFTAVATWVFYIALEPHVRRFWPQSIIAWSRVLLGKVRDPQVGRDILIGTAAGTGIVLIQQISVLLARWTGLDLRAAAGMWGGPELGVLVGFRDTVGALSRAILASVWAGLGLLLLFLLLRLALRGPRVAAAAFVLLATLMLTISWESAQSLPWLTGLAVAPVLALVLTRAGLLAGTIGLLTMFLLANTPLTLDMHAWYAESTAMILTFVGGLLAFGLHASLLRRAG